MPELPTGTVTFLLTDIEGSTRLWERYAEEARSALVRHDAIVEAAVSQHNGSLVRPRGEGEAALRSFHELPMQSRAPWRYRKRFTQRA